MDKQVKFEELVSMLCDSRPGLSKDEVRRVIAEAVRYGVQIGFQDGVEYAIANQEKALKQLKNA